MATILGETDQDLVAVQQRLEQYEQDHPGSEARLYRQQQSPSIRIRVVDNRFAGMSRSSRHVEVWRYLENLNEDVLAQITVLLTLPTSELRSNLMNLEFEDPIRTAI